MLQKYFNHVLDEKILIRFIGTKYCRYMLEVYLWVA